MQYGVFAANYPLTDDDLESRRMPRALDGHPQKLFGLTIRPDRLQQIRNERKPDSRYSSAAQVAFEVRAAESLFERHGVPVLDATEVSIEEISTRILDRMGLERRLRP
jgi:regulator of PEP synthase PpsR (kinase-PPPase family)